MVGQRRRPSRRRGGEAAQSLGTSLPRLLIVASTTSSDFGIRRSRQVTPTLGVVAATHPSEVKPRTTLTEKGLTTADTAQAQAGQVLMTEGDHRRPPESGRAVRQRRGSRTHTPRDRRHSADQRLRRQRLAERRTTLHRPRPRRRHAASIVRISAAGGAPAEPAGWCGTCAETPHGAPMAVVSSYDLARTPTQLPGTLVVTWIAIGGASSRAWPAAASTSSLTGLSRTSRR